VTGLQRWLRAILGMFMADESLDNLYSFLAQAYIRLQAEEALGLCLEAGETTPMQGMVEKLVLAGPASLSALREILNEVEVRQVKTDQNLRLAMLDLGGDPGPLLRELGLIREIVRYLRDWMNGLMYLSARQEPVDESAFPAKMRYPL
jgi:hypothetical protein